MSSQPDSVLELVHSRLRELADGKHQFSDGAKLGLIVEGGGVRGALSAGALMALSDAKALDIFDVFYGNSAGAINTAYALVDQVHVGAGIYLEDLTKSEFLNLKSWPDMIKIKAIFEECIAAGTKKLDLERLAQIEKDFYVAVTRVRDGNPQVFNVRGQEPQRIFSLLRASAATPMMTTHQEEIDGELFNDGDIHSAIPIAGALESGCTHILALLTKERGYRRKPHFAMRLLERLRMRSYSKSYKQEFFSGPHYYNRALEKLFNPDENVKTLVICPEPGEFLVSSHERRPEPIERALCEAKTRAQTILKLVPRQ